MLLTAQTVVAASPSDDGFDYPELQVTPLASERIDMEAAREGQGQWTRHLPIQLSALATTVLGLRVLGIETDGTADDPDAKGIPALAVGVGWLATTLYLSASYRPYSTAAADLREQHKGGKGRRETLIRERMAEERLNAIARTGRTLMWLSVGTNLAAAGYSMSTVDTDLGRVMGIASGVLALTPVLFQYDWQRVASQQEEYKKRIFGTFAYRGSSLGFVKESRGGGLAPALNLSLAF